MDYHEKLEARKVLVTGAGGFVGSHLVEQLVEHGSDVTAFVRATPAGDSSLHSVEEEVEVHRGDLQDPSSVRSAVKKLSGQERVIVFHLGAQAHVGESWRRPHETIRTNVLGTLNLLQALEEEEVDLAKVSIAGSSEEYGREGNGGQVLDEESALSPKSIYATSKVAQDFLGRNYYDAYGIPVVRTRMFNNYGPRQSPRFITGTVISQALMKERVELGNLEPVRDMCYIRDGVRAHLDVALEGEPGEVYTFGKGESVSMRDWAEKILEVGRRAGYWENPEIVQEEERHRPGDSDVRDLEAGYSKLNQLTGWEPRVSWDEGIRKTVEWYSRNRDWWLPRCDWR